MRELSAVRFSVFPCFEFERLGKVFGLMTVLAKIDFERTGVDHIGLSLNKHPFHCAAPVFLAIVSRNGAEGTVRSDGFDTFQTEGWRCGGKGEARETFGMHRWRRCNNPSEVCRARA
jgi:hypothetical protein